MAYDITTFLPFIIPGLTALVFLVKKGTSADINLAALQKDIAEVKTDVKEVRQEQLHIMNSVQEMKSIEDRLKRNEVTTDENTAKLNDALRYIDVLKVRVSNLEWNKGMRRTGAVEDKNGDVER